MQRQLLEYNLWYYGIQLQEAGTLFKTVLRREKRIITNAALRRANTRGFTGNDILISLSLCLSFSRAACAPPGLSRGLSTVWHITRDARSGLRGRTGGATLGAGTRSRSGCLSRVR